MKTTSYKLILIFMLLPLLGFCGNNSDTGRHTKQKKITKTFNVSKNALLEIDNSYGNVDITTWNQNRVEIEVIITTNGNDEEKVIERLKEIGVNFSNSSSRVTAKTYFKREDSSWWNKLFNSSSDVNMEINYRIKAPVSNDVDVSNDYGNISIDKLEGNAKLSCDYGRLLLGELRGDKNLLSFDYTRNSQIEYINRGKINADYSEFTIEEAGVLELSADYTDSYIKKVEHLNFNGDYGNLKIDKVKNVVGQGDYLGTKLGSVYGSAQLNLDYGSASIARVMKSAQKVEISSDYTGIKIGYDSESSFRFNIRTSYGSIRGLDRSQFEVDRRHEDGSDVQVEGYYRNNSGAVFTINSSYGNITFTD